MASLEKIQAINKVIKQYFDLQPRETRVPAKDLMTYFIKAGIFPKDHRNGLPIRDILRKLDQAQELHLVPYAHPERKISNTNWFFVRRSKASPIKFKDNALVSKIPPPERLNKVAKQQRDEHYVLDLCDSLLNEKSLRQHRFDFLTGDAGTKLPVDAFYPKYNLVIEYRERQHTEPVKHFDKPDIITVSGVDRGKQRALYDERRRKVFAAKKINLIEIPYSLFTCDSRRRIVRGPNDKVILKKFLTNRI